MGQALRAGSDGLRLMARVQPGSSNFEEGLGFLNMIGA